MLAKQQTRDGCGDWSERTSDLLGRVGFHVPEVDVAGSALERKDDERPGAGPRSDSSLHAEQIGKAETKQAAAAGAKENPPIQRRPAANAPGGCSQVEHGNVTSTRDAGSVGASSTDRT